MNYQIETRSKLKYGDYEEWSIDGLDKLYETEEEALEMIPGLRKLGDYWAEAEYRVVEIPVEEELEE